MTNKMECDIFPVKFTDAYLKDGNNSHYQGISYDDDIEDDKDAKYVEHFFQLNDWLKFSFRYYTRGKLISNIYIMDDDSENSWEKFYRLPILNKLIEAFDIPNNKFDWDFNFEKYEY